MNNGSFWALEVLCIIKMLVVVIIINYYAYLMVFKNKLNYLKNQAANVPDLKSFC